MAKLIGQGGNITVSTVDYPVTEWSANITNDVQDVTDTDSGGWVSRLAGVSACEITFTAFWGSSATQLSTTFAVGATVSADLGIGGSAVGVSGSFIVSSFTIKNSAKEAVTFECTAGNIGAVTVS